MINEWNKLPNDCVNASSVNMFKNRIDRVFDKGRLHIDHNIVGLSMSQWLPCPLAIWNFLFGMAILLNLESGSFIPISGINKHRRCSASFSNKPLRPSFGRATLTRERHLVRPALNSKFCLLVFAMNLSKRLT